MKPVYHKVVTCQHCGKEYDKGKLRISDWHKYEMCVPPKLKEVNYGIPE